MSNVYYQMAFPIAKHEFGHYLTAKYLNFKVGRVEVNFEGRNQGGSSVIEPATPLIKINEIEIYLRNRVAVLYAGSLAESLAGGKADTRRAVDILNMGGKSDYDKARELVHLRRSLLFPNELVEKEVRRQLRRVSNHSWDIARRAVERYADVIEILASELANRVAASQRDGAMEANELSGHPALRGQRGL